MRVLETHRPGERRAASTLLAEVFNVFNRKNYGNYNTTARLDVVRPAGGDVGQRLRAALGSARVPRRVLVRPPGGWRDRRLRPHRHRPDAGPLDGPDDRRRRGQRASARVAGRRLGAGARRPRGGRRHRRQRRHGRRGADDERHRRRPVRDRARRGHRRRCTASTAADRHRRRSRSTRCAPAASTRMPQSGIHSVTVPGAVAAWSTLSGRFGRLPLGDVLAPAIRIAGEGCPGRRDHGRRVGGLRGAAARRPRGRRASTCPAAVRRAPASCSAIPTSRTAIAAWPPTGATRSTPATSPGASWPAPRATRARSRPPISRATTPSGWRRSRRPIAAGPCTSCRPTGRASPR